MVEKNEKPVGVTELDYGEFAEILSAGLTNVNRSTVSCLVRNRILNPCRYEKGRHKFLLPSELLKAFCAIEIRKDCNYRKWHFVATTLGRGAVIKQGNKIKSSPEWGAVVEAAQTKGVNLDMFPNLKPIEED